MFVMSSVGRGGLRSEAQAIVKAGCERVKYEDFERVKAARVVFVAGLGAAGARQHAARTWDAASPVERRLRAWRATGA